MDEAGRKKLWDDYSKTRSPEDREKIILEYAPLVKVVAGRLSMYLGYNVDYEDLVSYGIFGLIDAIDKFDCMKDVKFETYASLRIRGAILDQIRKMDWIPRTIRQKQKKIDMAAKEIEAKHGRSATDEEIAENLGISEDEYLDWQSQMKITNVVSLNEFLEQGSEVPNEANQTKSSHFDSPEEVVEKEELKQMLAEALELLTEKEHKVILLYYYEELTLKEISSILEVSESRISQLHTRALQKMRVKLGNYIGILTGELREIHKK
jgi:RNA polymerase sigma factor for flagellar operon FliA